MHFPFQNNMLNRRAFSDLIPENVHGSRRKEEARQSEFLRIGQVGVVSLSGRGTQWRIQGVLRTCAPSQSNLSQFHDYFGENGQNRGWCPNLWGLHFLPVWEILDPTLVRLKFLLIRIYLVETHFDHFSLNYSNF